MPSFTGTELTGQVVHAYGDHIVNPHVVQKVTEGAGDTAVVTVVAIMGEGVWQGIDKMYWQGRELVEGTDYHFHPGYFPNDIDDTAHGGAQAVDPWVVGGSNYSGSAYVVVKLPGAAIDSDDFSGLKARVKCLLVMDYDASGNELGYVYTSNPANVFLDIYLKRRGNPKSRINFASWHAWKLFNAEQIGWTGGTIPGRPEYETNVGGVIGSDSAWTRALGGTGWGDAYAVTAAMLPDGIDSFFEADLEVGNSVFNVPLIGLVHDSSWTHEINADANTPLYLWHFNGLVTIASYGNDLATTSGTTGDRFRITKNAAGAITVQKNGVDIPDAVLNEPANYRGFVSAFNQTAGVIRATINPLNSGARTRERFVAGLAFINTTDAAAAQEAVLYVSCANYQDVDGQLHFIIPTSLATPREPTFDFTEGNIVEDTFQSYRLTRDQRPTHVIGKIRDLDTPYLTEEPIPADRDALEDILGRRIDGGEIYLGTMTQAQAKCVLNYQLRMTSDLDLFCSFEADGTTFSVAPGDVVTVTHSLMGWDLVKFLVISVEDNESGTTADTRTYTLQSFNAGTYSDDDQQPLSVNVPYTVPTSLTPAPMAEQIILTQSSGWGLNNAFTTIVEGEVVFAPFADLQRARIWIKKPSQPQPIITNIIVTPDAPNFSFQAQESGTYEVFAVTENRIGYRDPAFGVPGDYTSAAIGITAPAIALNPPVSPVATFAVNYVEISWGIPTNSERISNYEVWTNISNLGDLSKRIYFGSDNRTTYQFNNVAPPTQSFWVRSVNDMGLASSFVQVNAGVPVPIVTLIAPTNFTVGWNGRELIMSFTPLAPATNVANYQIATDSGFTNIVAQSRGGVMLVPLTALPFGRSWNFYLRALDALGNIGPTAVPAVQPTVLPTVGAPTVAFDPTRTYPFNAILVITPPVSLTDRRQIQSTVVETSTTPGFTAIMNTYTFDGVQEVADISGRFSTQPTIYARAYYIDRTNLAGTASTAASVTFTALIGADIGAGQVGITQLASSLAPPQIVATLPALPNAQYPPNASVVFNQADGKLYRNVANVWVAAVPVVDLTGAIGGGNLLTNSSFENPDLTGWMLNDTFGGTYSQSNTQARYGANSLKLILPSGNSGRVQIHPYFVCRANQPYVFSVWCYGLTSDVTLKVDGAAGYGSMTLVEGSAATWGRYELKFTPPADQAEALWVYANPTTSGVRTIYLDGMQLEAGQARTGYAPKPDEILPNTIDYSMFSTGLRPIETVAALPSLPAANYPIDAVVIYSSDHKLYRNVANAWVKTVDGNDLIANSVTAAAILAGTITGDKIAANTISVKNMLVGNFDNIIEDPGFERGGTSWFIPASAGGAGWTVQNSPANAQYGNYVAVFTPYASSGSAFGRFTAANRIDVVAGEQYYMEGWMRTEFASNTPTCAIFVDYYDVNDVNLSSTVAGFVGNLPTWTKFSTQLTIPAGATYARFSFYANGVIGKGKAYADSVYMRRIIDGNLIVDGTISATKLVAGSIIASLIAAGTITATQIAANTITAAQIAANTITAAQIAADTITAGQIAAGAIATSELAAGAVTAGKLAIGNFDNLVSDPGLERQGASGVASWTLGGGWTIAGGFQRSGSYYLNGLSAGTYALSDLMADCKPGDVFYAECYIKSTGGGPGFVVIDWLDVNKAHLSYSQGSSNAGAGVYVLSSLTATAPASAAYVRIGVTSTGTAGWMADDFYMRRVVDSVIIQDGAITAAKIAADSITAKNLVVGGFTDNLLSNASFEQLTDGWYIHNNNGVSESSNVASSSTSAEVVTDAVAPDGDKVARIFSVSSSNGHRLSTKVMPVQPGAVYALNYWAKQTNGAVVGNYTSLWFMADKPASGLYITSAESSGGATLHPRNNVTTPTSWTNYEHNFTVPAGMYWMVLLFQNFGGSSSYLHVDKVILKQQVGDAFIANLKASKIVADTIGAGLIFADQIKQASYLPYQPGSTYAPITPIATQGTAPVYTAATDSLTKTSGSAGGWDAGAASATFARIERGTGYAEWVMGTNNHYIMAGLTANFTVASFTGIDYALYTDASGNINIYEGGTLMATAITTYAVGDKMRVAIEDGGYVRYYKNDVLLFTSPYLATATILGRSYATAGGFRFAASFYDYNGIISKMKLVQGGYGAGWRLNPLSGSQVFDIIPVWQDLSGTIAVTFGGRVVSKPTGTGGWNSAVRSAQTIAAGDGYFEATLQATLPVQTMIALTASGDVTGDYTTADFAIFINSTTVQIYERGANPATFGSFANPGDVFRVAIEGGVVKYRKNGSVFWTSTNQAYLAYPSRARIMMQNVGDTLSGFGFTASSSGSGEFNSGITVIGERLEDTVRLVRQGIRKADNRWRGPDTDVPISTATYIDFHSIYVPYEDDRAYASLFLNRDDYQTNNATNYASVDHIRVRVYNWFGDPNLSYGFMYFPYNGRGLAGSMWHNRNGQDPWMQAVYSFEVHNLFGYSKPIFWTRGAWATAGARAGTYANYGNTPPIWKNAAYHPTNLRATPVSDTSVILNCTNPTAAPSATLTYYMRLYSSNPTGSWTSVGTSSTGTLTVTGLSPNTRYEFMSDTPSQGGNNDGNMWSNMAFARTLPTALAAPTFPAPTGVTAVATGNTTANLTWTANGSPTNIEISRRDVTNGGGWSVISGAYAGGQPYGDTGLTAGTTYAYKLRANFSGNFSTYSTEAQMTTQVTAPPSNTPTGLNAQSLGYYSVSAQWTTNGGGSNHRIEIVPDAGAGSFGGATVITGASSPRTITGLISGTVYRLRVRSETPSTSNWSNEALVMTDTFVDPDPGACIIPETMVTAMDFDLRQFLLRADEVKAGDTLVSIAKNGSRVAGRVKNVFSARTSRLFTIITTTGQVLTCSPGHPIIVGYGNQVKKAFELKTGESVLVYNQHSDQAVESRIASIEYVDIDAPVLIFEMENGEHTFVSGSIVSHNIGFK